MKSELVPVTLFFGLNPQVSCFTAAHGLENRDRW